MRLLVVSWFWPTPSNPISGVFVVQQVKAYAEAGCEVTVIAPQLFRGVGGRRKYHQRIANADVFSPTMADVPQALASTSWALRLNAHACARAIRKVVTGHGIGPEFDGVHIHDIRYCGLSYPEWQRFVHGPALLTVHGVDPLVSHKAGLGWLRHDLARMWSEVSGVVLVGAPLHSYADVTRVPQDKRFLIHNGSELPTCWDTKQRALTERRVVLSVSNLVELKGIDLNLAALSAIRQQSPKLEWEYRVVGDGPEMGALKKQAAALGIADRVVFLGRLGHAETLSEIARCDVFSLPSWGDSFGIVYLEAMGRGRPVIGCRGWGAAEMITDEQFGLLVEPKDTQSLLAALDSLLRDPGRCEAIGGAGRKQAETFSWKANVQKHIELLGHLS